MKLDPLETLYVEGTARTDAHTLGKANDGDLLQRTLRDEGETDKRLTGLAEESISHEAAPEMAGVSLPS